jgi:hypothetical protein
VFDIKPHPNLKSIYDRENAAQNADVIILTSRLERLRPQLEAILKANGIQADAVIMKRGAETKGDVILNYLDAHPEIMQVDVYDDFAGNMEDKKAEFNIADKFPRKIDYNIFYVENDQIKKIN